MCTKNVQNRCANCGVTITFDCLEARKCYNCDEPINVAEMQNVTTECYYCAQEMTYRVDVSNPEYIDYKDYLICDECADSGEV